MLTEADLARNDYVLEGFLEYAHLPNGWYPGQQKRNFEYLTKIVDYTGVSLKKRSVLDVGSGTGDLYLFLEQFRIGRYSGVDVYKPSVEMARQRFPEGRFLLQDFLDPKFSESTDYIFSSGALSVRFDQDNYRFLANMVIKMWRLARFGVAFNFLTDDDPDAHVLGAYYSVGRVIRICKSIDPRVSLHFVKDNNWRDCHIFLAKRPHLGLDFG